MPTLPTGTGHRSTTWSDSAHAPNGSLELVTHPDDVGKLEVGTSGRVVAGNAFAMETRTRRHDGALSVCYDMNPRRDERKRIVRSCGTRIDIHDRKQAEDRTQRENLVSREEIEQASMFEEIVGASRRYKKCWRA